MATTDANGQVFYGPTDPVTPIQGLLNGVSTAVSSKLGAQSQIVRIANVAGRAAAVTARAGRAITAADPLIVWRADAGDGYQIEYTTDGSAFRSVARGIDTGWIPATGNAGWGGTPSLRRVGSVVYCRGNWVRVGGAVSVPFNGPTLGTLPSGIPAPSAEMQIAAPNGVDMKIGIVITAAGGLFLRAHYGAAPTFPTDQYISFANISWPVD